MASDDAKGRMNLDRLDALILAYPSLAMPRQSSARLSIRVRRPRRATRPVSVSPLSLCKSGQFVSPGGFLELGRLFSQMGKLSGSLAVRLDDVAVGSARQQAILHLAGGGQRV